MKSDENMMGKGLKRKKDACTKETLTRDLQNLGLKKGMTIIVHSSLSSLGWVNGGSITVIQALMDILTKEGTIMMPSQSVDLSDPSTWNQPPVPEKKWEEIRYSMQPYHPLYTPTSFMGRIVDVFLTFPEVKRSSHPHYSFAGWGKYRDELINNHQLNFGLGKTSPLGRLYDIDNAHVLLLGVDYTSCTSFHLAEYHIPYQKIINNTAPMLEDDKKVWKTYQELEFRGSLFSFLGKSFEDETYVRKMKVGSAQARLFQVKRSVDYAKSWLTIRDQYNK